MRAVAQAAESERAALLQRGDVRVALSTVAAPFHTGSGLFLRGEAKTPSGFDALEIRYRGVSVPLDRDARRHYRDASQPAAYAMETVSDGEPCIIEAVLGRPPQRAGRG